MRTARSRTSGENFDFLILAPSSQMKEPPQKPGRFTESLEQCEAIGPRQHDVEQKQVVASLHRHVAPVDPIGCDIDDVAALGQPPTQMACQLGVVFDDEDSHGRLQRSA
ncbi:MAG: hypothetical protein HY856_16945 [Burkholderiales bacterium]|nr:hypothetical protein [Burkholderiales bacterium]